MAADATEIRPRHRYLSVTEAARVLNVDPRTVRAAIDKGDLPARLVNGVVRIPYEALDELPFAGRS
jgi:excisionase family DNA binding protein